MATKFQLQPKPTFKANVTIPRAGDDDGRAYLYFPP
ncbi:Uncharacterised protein [Leclercia adecarboxylata]|uniref:Uncharacterized protein n=1 Tax=Leclercia adecarboxylata TaxID=83655 RepID=A0A4V6JIU4_9ENTR|nr:Uncharacterised protein [Leclercia adecarboxylata]